MKVALYIPCFNAEKTIDACLRAVFSQERKPDTVLLVDDGSTDSSVEIAKRYPLKIIKHEGNLGLAAARNTAVKNMECDLIASLDSDCRPDKNWLGNLCKSFTSTDIAGLGGRVEESAASGVLNLWRSMHMQQHWGGSKETNPPFLFGSNTLFRRKLLVEAGFYNTDYKNNYEDVDMSNRLRNSGYNLIYEPQAVVFHLKEDNINSLLNTFWKWNHAFYVRERFYENPGKFIEKIKDNIGLANRFLDEDLSKGKKELAYLDFLTALHHSFRDFEYFNSCRVGGRFEIEQPIKLSFWLSLLDLTFFYHFDGKKKKLSSFIPDKDMSQQNFLALNLAFYDFMKKRFTDKAFRKIFYGHLLFSVYRIEDSLLLEKLFNLFESHNDWNVLIKKEQANLNKGFLEALLVNLINWIEHLIASRPGIVGYIEDSAQKTERSVMAS
ncbi:MAG: glycosyltransferase [Candidatus Omnitrophica bacterium]|nr:glycosyltransferase [Candidatus Omnitrophota bacterium]MDD5500414.1 glycosyltransferase [Candidatus Omnitrophota bacterium]